MRALASCCATCVPVLTALMLTATSAAAQKPIRYEGRSLTEALQALQSKGLRIVFSSATVPRDLEVVREPRAATPREQLDELLAPHGLEVKQGPGGTLQVVRVREPPKQSRPPVDAAARPRPKDAFTARPLAHIFVRVDGNSLAPYRKDPGVSSEMIVGRTVFGRVHGSLAEDPVRVVQALPRVAAVDDFRSDIAVRGSPFRHADLVIDGVSTGWLQHTAHDRGATGSLPMLSGLVLEDATLRTGAYPRRHGDRLGPELDLALREGSRSDLAVRGAIGGTHVTLLGEGPIGAARGSWLVATRQSYLEWPPERSQSHRTSFGFTDGVAKVVLDVRPAQQLAVTALGGVSAVDGEDGASSNEPGDGMNRASLLNLSWRSTFGSALVLRQRAHLVRHRFLNKDQSGRDVCRGSNRETGYRADLTWATAGGLLDAGAQVARTTAADVCDSREAAGSATSWVRAGYAHFAWAATPAITLSPGLRLTSSTLLRDPTVSWWLLGEWAFRPGWSLTGSAGVSRQGPEHRATFVERGSLELRPERARHLDVGLEQLLTSTVRWQITTYVRRETEVLRAPDLYPRLVGATLVFPERERYANAIQGTSSGIELLLERRSALGLAGWATYSYGRTLHEDTMRSETYPGDFDQRHSFSLFGVFRTSSGWSAGATFRAGSNFPIPGYLAESDGRLVIGGVRNQVRLPTYVRLDLRADRHLEYRGRRLTPFVEVLNVLNRANQGAAKGWVDPVTGRATGFTDTQLRRRFSAGIVIEF